MLRDLHESLEDIHVGPVSMKERIREIQPYIIPRSSAQQWAQHLTASGVVKHCNDYVAVSYRWPKSDGLPDKPLDECFTVHIETGVGSRTNLAPTNVLERAMSFAERHNYRLMWIDQKCIEQRDDRQDKEFGIQSMD